MWRILPLALIVAFVAACGATTPVTRPFVGAAASTEAVAESSPTPEVTPTPGAGDFDLRVKTLKQECFGSAGCNVTFTIRVAYTGSPLPADVDYHVTYKVTGGEEPFINTFTLTGDQATVTEEEFISTSSAAAKLRAKVTEVE
ncbi:hypothetical protein [Streptosporangium roseum]|uniref:hypothetical protein n=1 Tax=Streptosporangium roseum TaxID=2001 RepID=UPI0012DFD274|nr:hypothetical protein [Streptosporangium roseum]